MKKNFLFKIFSTIFEWVEWVVIVVSEVIH